MLPVNIHYCVADLILHHKFHMTSNKQEFSDNHYTYDARDTKIVALNSAAMYSVANIHYS